MKPVKGMTRAELAAYVQGHLDDNGITVVLSGGAAVSIYSGDKYVTMDLDLVNIYSVKRRAIRQAMQAIDFHEEGRYFAHPDTPYFVEFPPGPLSIGEEPIQQINELQLTTGF